jgi:hypothetical protein
MPHYKGQCHCGAVTFEVESEKPIETGLRCNCSICVRKGAVMSSDVYPEDALNIEAGDSLGMYQLGDKTAKHYFCKKCGIYPFHETARFPGKLRVNLGCFDELEPLKLEVGVFDGKHLL